MSSESDVSYIKEFMKKQRNYNTFQINIIL